MRRTKPILVHMTPEILGRISRFAEVAYRERVTPARASLIRLLINGGIEAWIKAEKLSKKDSAYILGQTSRP